MGQEHTSDQPMKLVKKFDWGAVDADLLRQLLIEAYEGEDKAAEVAKLQGMAEDVLPVQARRSFGSPLSMKAMDSDALVDGLRYRWLPRADRSVLDDLVGIIQLSLSGADRNTHFSTKREIVEFLQARNRTVTLRKNLRKAFVSAHKIPTQVSSGSSVRQGSAGGGRVKLVGIGATDPRPAYSHQKAAWEAMDNLLRSSGSRSGILELPTGAGKTHTTVRWLIDRLAADPDLRVLWIADKKELVGQAHRAFVNLALTMPDGVIRFLRSIHGGASPASSLADPGVRVVCVTRQSLIGSGLDAAAKKRLRAFGSGPLMVVVDEAHHAVSPTYHRLLSFLDSVNGRAMFIGLTATPWPTGYGMTARLRESFPTTIHSVSPATLVDNGILARPQNHQLLTREYVDLTTLEAKQIAGTDLPPSVLRKLDRPSRNKLIVETWLNRRTLWGKTLVFVGDIAHADRLGDAFRNAGVSTLVMHSQIGEEATAVLDEFRRSQGPSVLISVGMLLEGVDVPDARTAFLARPTTSRVLMRQMIGRVLRGPTAGGDPIAHVVDVRDRWDEDVDVLEPVEIPDIEWEQVAGVPDEGEDREFELPRIRDEKAGGLLSEDLVHAIQKAFVSSSRPLPEARAFASINLIGYYQLGHLNVPVFEHTQVEWDELVQSALRGRSLGFASQMDAFDHVACPQPTKRDVKSVIEFCKSNLVEPPFVEAHASVSVRAVAETIVRAGPLSEDVKVERLTETYRSTLCRGVYGSFQSFYEAVHQEILALTVKPRTGCDAESPTSAGPPVEGRRKLRQLPDRTVGDVLNDVAHTARQLLRGDDYDYVPLLAAANLPRIAWTPRNVKRAYAYWSPRISGKAKGTPIIRVNRALRVSKSAVPDDLLAYLVWHELCHHLLPGRGHDAEFRRLESMWADSARLDHELDSLSEQFDLG